MFCYIADWPTDSKNTIDSSARVNTIEKVQYYRYYYKLLVLTDSIDNIKLLTLLRHINRYSKTIDCFINTSIGVVESRKSYYWSRIERVIDQPTMAHYRTATLVPVALSFASMCMIRVRRSIIICAAISRLHFLIRPFDLYTLCKNKSEILV